MAIRTLGNTVAISVGAASHASVVVGTGVTDACSKAAFLNTGATIVAITVSPLATAPVSIFPVDGTPAATTIVLPAAMTAPVVFCTPFCPFSVTAIGSAAGPGIVYITPCED